MFEASEYNKQVKAKVTKWVREGKHSSLILKWLRGDIESGKITERTIYRYISAAKKDMEIEGGLEKLKSVVPPEQEWVVGKLGSIMKILEDTFKVIEKEENIKKRLKLTGDYLAQMERVVRLLNNMRTEKTKIPVPSHKGTPIAMPGDDDE